MSMLEEMDEREIFTVPSLVSQQCLYGLVQYSFSDGHTLKMASINGVLLVRKN